MTQSRVIHVGIPIPRKYKIMMPSVTRGKFITTKFNFTSYTKDISNQVSSNLDHEIKRYSCSNSNNKMGKKRKSGKKISGLQNGVIKRLQMGAYFRVYKSGQKRLQIGSAVGILNRVRDYKSVQNKPQISKI